MNDTPIILNASVQMERGNGGLDVDLTAMQSTSRHWLRIDELRVFIDPGESASETSVDQEIDLGYIVDVAIACGNEDLTTGFIGTQVNPTGERIAYVPAILLGPRVYRRFTNINNNNTNYTTDQNAYTWTLPRPMYVQPGTPVKFKVRRTGQLSNLDNSANLGDSIFTVEVAALGVRLAKKPSLSRRCLPHLHGWSPRHVNADRVESGEAFRNLHHEVLNLTRYIGTTATNKLYTVGTVTPGPTPYESGQPGQALDPTQIQLYDAHNQDILVPLPSVPVTSPPVPNVSISSLFLTKMNSVRVDDRLKPNQTYRAIVGPVRTEDAYIGRDLYRISLPMLGLESYREVSL